MIKLAVLMPMLSLGVALNRSNSLNGVKIGNFNYFHFFFHFLLLFINDCFCLLDDYQ